MISLQSTKEGYKVKPRMEKVTVCFKKSNGYLQKVVNCHMYACAFCCPPPLAPPPWRLVWRDHVSLAEVRHAEDNMTPRSHLRSLLIFDRSLNRYFGAKRDNGACRSAIRLSSFFFFKLQYVSCMFNRLQSGEIFSTKLLFATRSRLISLCSERK